LQLDHSSVETVVPNEFSMRPSLDAKAVNAGMLVALGVTRFTGWERADSLFAFVTSGYMLSNGRNVAREVLRQLLYQPP
jgi:divalent metal cation (Fe/Co/Zn/Cd) transporter